MPVNPTPRRRLGRRSLAVLAVTLAVVVGVMGLVGGAAAATTSGPLYVDSSAPYFLKDASGKAVFLTGSHYGWELQDNAWGQLDFNFDDYLNMMVDHNQNLMRMWSVESTTSSGSSPTSISLTNGGFESGSFTGWTYGDGTPIVVTSNAHSGTHAAQLSTANTWLNQSVSGLTAGVTYTVHAFVKDTGNGSVQLGVSSYDTTIGTTSATISGSTYTDVTAQFTPTGTTANIWCWRVSGTTGSSYCDDFTVTAQYLASPMPFERADPGVFGLATDGQPKFDLANLNQAYFTRLADRVAAAQADGIYVSIMLFQGVDTSNSGLWDDDVYNPSNNVNGISATSMTAHATTTLPSTVSLTNPSFEAGSFTGWTYGAGTPTVVSSNAHSGTYAAQLSTANTWLNQDLSGLTAGVTYTVHAFIKDTGNGSVQLGVSGYDTTYGTTSATVSGSTYTEVTTRFTPTGTTAHIWCWRVSGTTGSSYCDDFSVTG
jgi:hypothetical protein